MRVVEERAKLNPLLALLPALVAVAGALSWSQPGVAGSDLWWHLASGREIWQDLAVHSTDPFSYTFGGREWLNHEWFWDVIYWGIYRIHTQAVAWFNLGLIATIFTLVYRVGVRESGSRLAAGATLWLVAASAHWFLDLRPHLFTLLFVSLFLLTREHPRAPWLWPPLVVLWANLHSGFVFGVGMIGLFVGVRTLEASLRERRLVLDRAAWISVGLCVLAMLVNPWGYRILAYPLAYLNAASPFRSIIEWQPPEFALNLHEFNGRYTAVCLLTALGVPVAILRRAFYPLALILVTFAMAYTSRRFIPLFGVTAAPLGAMGLAWLLERLAGLVPRDALRPRVRSALWGTGLGLAALLAAGLWRDVRLYPRLLERWTESSLYPDAALRYLKAVGLPERVLNYYNWGGYIMLHAPGLKVFIDGRANTLYDDRIYLDYLTMLGGRPGTLALAHRYRADVALVPAGGAFARALRTGSEAWQEIYSDTVARILVPPDSPYLKRELPDPGVVLAGHPERLLRRSDRALRERDLDAAQADLERAVAQDPLLLRGWARLAHVHLIRRDRVAVERTLQRALHESPRSIAYLKRAEGQIWERLGDLERALAAYRDAIPRGPFSNPSGMHRLVRRLERQLERGRS